MGEKCEDIYLPCQCLPKGVLRRGDFNNQVAKMTFYQSAFPWPPLLLSTDMHTVAMVAGVEVLQGISNVGSTHPGLSGHGQ